MSPCDEILDRLYDEDCRLALEGGGPLPADVAGHVAACTACRSLCDELRADLLTLPAALVEDAPWRSRAAALALLADRYPARQSLDWRSALVWAVTGAALAGCAVVFAGPLLSQPWPAVLVTAAGCLSLATELTRQALEA